MIYFVTNQLALFNTLPDFKIISVEESLSILNPLEIVGLDTETTGMDVFAGKLLTLQLGNKDFQVVIDCTTINVLLYKEYLESNRLFIMHNAKFDLKWLYKFHIVPIQVYDTYLAEKILYLGYPSGMIGLSLQACCDRYLKVFLDKSVRGQIHRGLTDDVIEYAAKDVVYLEDIMNLQLKEIKARDQELALSIENQFVRVLTYIEYCGIKLDPVKWKNKMEKDLDNLKNSERLLNEWVINYVMSNKKSEHILENFIETKKTSKYLKNNIFVIIPPKSLFDEFDVSAKCIINWNSSNKVIPLFETLGLDLYTKDKKTGKIKKSVEAKFIKGQEKKSDIIPLYLQYSKDFKSVTSFGQNYLDAIHPITKRIHPTFNQLMDTGRISCGSGGKGGSNKINEDSIQAISDKSINIQQLPATSETRECFIPEDNYLLIDCDYGDQEGKVFAELTGDKEWISFYNDPNPRDGHAFVAKMCFPKELDGIEEMDVKKVRKDLRALAKSARFCFNYNGQAPTMATNCNIPLNIAIEVYNNYFKRFSGIANYFKKQKKEMWERGYILISEITKLRSYIYDHKLLKDVEKRLNSSFWDMHRIFKSSPNIIKDIPTQVIQKVVQAFANGEDINSLARSYSYTEKVSSSETVKTFDINIESVYTTVVKYLFKRKSASDNQSCNYTSQGSSAAMTKIAAIRYFNHLVKNNLIFKVFISNIVHDELLTESPKEIAQQEAQTLSECMEYAANIFCKKVSIKAIPEIGPYWIH